MTDHNFLLKLTLNVLFKKHSVLSTSLMTRNHPTGKGISALHKAFIATPHIAGYSADGKSTATRMIVEAVGKWLGKNIPTTSIVPPPPTRETIDLTEATNPLQTAVWESYIPFDDDSRLRKSPETFEVQRGLYPLRREFPAYRITGSSTKDASILKELGFNIV